MSKSNTKGRRRVTFSVKAEPGSAVFLAGSFNDWQPAGKPLKEQPAGTFSTTVMLAPGQYQYKFVINGVWSLDPANGDWVANDVGSLNSVRQVS